MTLVNRNGRPYLYRSVRRDGRATSEYVASGSDALLLARLDRIERDDRDFRRWRELQVRKTLDDLDRALDDLTEQALALARAALTAAGFHQHARSSWRRRRVQRPT